MNIFSNMKIKVKLLALILSIAILPLLIVGMLSYFASKKDLVQGIGQNLENLAFETTDKIDRSIYERRQNIKAWAKLNTMQDVLIDDADERIFLELKRLKEDYGVYQDMYLLNDAGIIITSSNEVFPDTNFEQSSWYANSISKKIDINDVAISELTGELSVSFSAPVVADYDEDTVLGVLTSRLDWEQLMNMVSQISLGGKVQDKNSYIVILNNKGQVISGPEFLRGSILKETFDNLDSFKKAVQDKKGYLNEKVNGTDMFVGFAMSEGYEDYEGLGWVTLVFQSSDVALASVSSLKVKIVLLVLLTILIVVFLGLIIVKGIIKPIDYLNDNMEEIEKTGDLSTRLVPMSSDELGQMTKTFNAMIEKFYKIVSKIKTSSEQVSQSSLKVSSFLEQMAVGADAQQGQTGQVATAVEEMSAIVNEIAQNSMTASSEAEKSTEVAKEGSLVLEEAVTGMVQISATVKESSRTMEELGKSSDEIGNIISVIDEIADQTNLLALNAAIEAARAGDQGRGFAVVADEVRKLAERTTSATKEIASMIGSIQIDTKSAIKSMSSGTESVDKGVELMDKAGSSLKQIDGFAATVSDMIRQIATASEEQSVAFNEISKNIDEVNDITKQSTEVITQSSTLTKELVDLSDDLTKMVEQFKL